MSTSQLGLLRERRFLPFFLTQFLGAFNDNLYKNSLVILVAFNATHWTTLPVSSVSNLAAGLFILPFFLFSATCGQLADKYEKSGLIRVTKLLEIAVMGIAVIGFFLHSLPVLLVALFLLGTQATLFGPVKYALLPQTLAQDELVGGNAFVEAGTFVAILFGTLLGGLLAGLGEHGQFWISLAIVLLAVLGYLTSRQIPPAAPIAPDLQVDWNPFTETWRNFTFMRGQRTVFLSVLGISWFWLYGSVFLAQFPAYTKVVLGGSEGIVTLLLTMFSVGIGVGSLLCERLSGHKIEIGLVPFGSIGLSCFGIDLYWASPASPAAGIAAMEFLHQTGSWRILFDLVMIGMFGGFYIVPLYALIQSRSDPAHRSRIIAGNNILNALFMVVAVAASIGLLAAGLTIPQLLLTTALMNAAVALFIYRLVPEFLMRFIVWLLIHSIYRLDKRGLDHIPAQGAAVLVCNHVSFVDALVIAAACPRPIRFVMDHQIFRTPIVNFVFKETRAIPIAPAKADPVVLERAYDEIAHALEAGELIGIFPEGRITDTGELYPFKGGITRILHRTPVPVIPMALRGMWGSFFSRLGGPAMTKPLRRGLFTRIELVVDAPLVATEVTPERLQVQVAELRGDWR